jgi:hypothetical protein
MALLHSVQTCSVGMPVSDEGTSRLASPVYTLRRKPRVRFWPRMVCKLVSSSMSQKAPGHVPDWDPLVAGAVLFDKQRTSFRPVRMAGALALMMEPIEGSKPRSWAQPFKTVVKASVIVWFEQAGAAQSDCWYSLSLLRLSHASESAPVTHGAISEVLASTPLNDGAADEKAKHSWG